MMSIQVESVSNYGGVSVIGHHNQVTQTIYRSIEHKDLISEREKIKNRISEIQKRITRYPADEDFKKDLLKEEQELKKQDRKIEIFENEIRKSYEEINSFPINTERLGKIKQLFNSGEFSKARALFDAESDAMKAEGIALLAERDSLKEKVLKNSTLLTDKANEYLEYARFTLIDFQQADRFEKANTFFQESLKYERNVFNRFAYAEFLADHGQINNAIVLYEELESEFRTIIQERKDFLIPKFADVLNNLGGLKLKRNEFELAIKYFEEAINIQERLIKNGLEDYNPSLALSKNNLAHLFEEQEKFDKAIELYEKAILIRKRVAEKINITSNQATVADSLNDKAICIAKKTEKEKTGNLQEAEDLFAEALAIQKKLNVTEPDKFLPEIATTLGNLSNVYSVQKRFDLAETVALECLEIRKKLYQINPYTFAEDFAKSLAIVGLRIKESSRYEEADKFLIESLQIFQRLAQSNRQVHAINVASTAANLSSFYFNEMPDKERSLYYAQLAIVNTIDLLGRLPLADQIAESLLLSIVRIWNEDPKAFLETCILENERLKTS